MNDLRGSRTEDLVRAEGVAKTFEAPSRVQAVREASVTIRPGELIALVGPSGAGKSTLLGILGGLQAPTAGKVLIRGADLYAMNSTAVARFRNLEIGFVFQFHHLLPELTAEENVELPGRIALREGWGRLNPRSLKDRARALLAAVGLESRAEHLPVQLSGGEAQRVSLARALMNEPALVLADEPTGNLDQVTSSGLMDLIQALNRDSRQAFLIATHNADLVSRASRVLRIRNGAMEA